MSSSSQIVSRREFWTQYIKSSEAHEGGLHPCFEVGGGSWLLYFKLGEQMASKVLSKNNFSLSMGGP